MISAPATVRKVEIASQRRAVAASALVSALAVVLCVITPSAASAQQPGQFDDRVPDPNVPPLAALGFNAEGSWLEGPLDGRIYRWDGKALTAPLRNIADVPAGLRNPSEFMVRYAEQRASAEQTSSPIRASAAAAGSSDTDAQDPLLVHDTAPTSFTVTTGSVIHGSGARVKNGMLTFTDVATGAKTTLRVARPAYLSAQMAAMAQLGASGPWIWVSDDHQQGRLISVETNGSVTATVVPGANALGMLPSAAPH